MPFVTSTIQDNLHISQCQWLEVFVVTKLVLVPISDVLCCLAFIVMEPKSIWITVDEPAQEPLPTSYFTTLLSQINRLFNMYERND